MQLTLDPGVFRARDDGLDEFIRNVLCIPIFDSLDEIRAINFVSFALRQSIYGNLDPIPSLVSVHGVVSSSNRSNLSHSDLFDIVLQLLDIL